MWNEPSPEELARLPKLYSTESTRAEDKIIHMKFFLGPATWYVAEYEPKERLFFGYADLGDPVNAEWGYIPFDELRELNVHGVEVDRNLYWKPKKFRELGY